MTLVKQPININFSKGLDTKTDPFQIPIGNFQALNNSVFTKGGMLQKRPGFPALTPLPDSTTTHASTFNGELTVIGPSFQVLSSSTNKWVNKGTLQPLTMRVQTLLRNNLNQSQADAQVAANGLICTAYTEASGVGSNTAKYVVADSSTGQNIISPTVLTTLTDVNKDYASPRVFLMGSYFIIVYSVLVTATFHLKFIAISTNDPTQVTASADISTSYTPATTVSFDGAVLNGQLYLAWNGASASGIKMAYIGSNLSVTSTVIQDAAHVATMMSVTADTVNSVIWATYYDLATTTGYTIAVDPQMVVLPNFPSQWKATENVLNVATSATAGTMFIFYEVSNTANGIPANFISRKEALQSIGVTGSAVVVARSVGLASKALVLGDTIYFLVAYGSPYQPTYFLMTYSGTIVAKLAYQNGGGYLTAGLPNFTVSGEDIYIPYLFKDLIQSVNKNTNIPTGSQTAGIYSQTGVNLAVFTLGTSNIFNAEIGSNLNITGGATWAYDGYQPVEQNFFLWPEGLTATTNASAVTPNGTVINGSNIINSVTSMAGVGLGAKITGLGIPANQVVTGFTATTITFGPLVATSGHVSTPLTITGQVDVAQKYYYQATYEWTDNQGNAFRSAPSIPITVTTTGTTSTNTLTVPTLRLTYKTSNPVKIVLYRWSVAQQAYYQVTSLTSPTMNDTTTDSVTIVDCLSDSTILGNNLIYTTGGVVENIGPPSFRSVFTFDDRLWGIPSEDPNLLWFSKEVIEGTPVEMSDLFTKFVAPGLGAQGPTGELNCGAQMDDKAILFKSHALYYINGTGPDNTGANDQYSQPIFITSTVGCTNQSSIVLIPQGLMFEFSSESGNQIWILNRDLGTQYIGAPVESVTQNATVTSAVNIPGTNQVRFTLSTGDYAVYDYYYEQWDTFRTGQTAASSTLYQGAHTYISPRGQVFQQSQDGYLDGTAPVLLSLTTGWINLAGIRGYQRAYAFYLLGKYLTPFKLLCSIAYDYNESPIHFATINPTNFSPTFGGAESDGQSTVYGQDTPYGGNGNVLNWRVFLKKQRCAALQITLQEIYDPSLGVAAGAGFSLSGLSVLCAIKSGFKTIAAKHTVGAR